MDKITEERIALDKNFIKNNDLNDDKLLPNQTTQVIPKQKENNTSNIIDFIDKTKKDINT